MAEKIQYHWQLDVYKLSVEAAMEIYELSKSFTKDEVKAQKFRPETDGTGMILLANSDPCSLYPVGITDNSPAGT